MFCPQLATLVMINSWWSLDYTEESIYWERMKMSIYCGIRHEKGPVFICSWSGHLLFWSVSSLKEPLLPTAVRALQQGCQFGASPAPVLDFGTLTSQLQCSFPLAQWVILRWPIEVLLRPKKCLLGFGGFFFWFFFLVMKIKEFESVVTESLLFGSTKKVCLQRKKKRNPERERDEGKKERDRGYEQKQNLYPKT